MPAMKCDGDDNPKKQLFVRGSGSTPLLLVGIDSSARELLTRLANHTCPIDTGKEPALSQILRDTVKLHIVAEYSQTNVLSYLRGIGASALLVFASGPPHSVIFNAGENTPRLFDKTKFDQSLERAFLPITKGAEQSSMGEHLTAKSGCEDRLSQTKTAALVDQMSLGPLFELGVGIGCGNSSEQELATSRLDAALTAIIETMLNVLRRDQVKEFSVVPSIAPTDHFTTNQIQTVTQYGFDKLDLSGTCSAKLFEVDGIKLRSMGTHRGPHTLVVSVEMKTESLVYNLGARLCDQRSSHSGGTGTTPIYLEEEDRQVQRILEGSTVVLAPSIPHTQLNCHDYATISPFIPLLTKIFEVIPEIDFVIVLATGGIKVRFIDVLRPGVDSGMTKNGTVAQFPSMEDFRSMSETDNEKGPELPTGNWTVTPQALAQLYVEKHEQMHQSNKDMCATNRPSTPVLDEFHWSMNIQKWAAAPDALLVQTGCCYEGQGVGHLFDENRRALFDILEKRLQGLTGTVNDMAGDSISGANISVWAIGGSGTNEPRTTKTTGNGNYHLALEPGSYRILVSDKEFDPMSATFTISTGHQVVRDFALHRPFRMSLERSLIAALIALAMLSISFYCLCKSLRGWKRPKSTPASSQSQRERRKDGFERVPLKVSLVLFSL